MINSPLIRWGWGAAWGRVTQRIGCCKPDYRGGGCSHFSFCTLLDTMAACLALPCAALSDEDEATPTVMESTAADVADHAGPRKGGTALPEVSFISPGLENPAQKGEVMQNLLVCPL